MQENIIKSLNETGKSKEYVSPVIEIIFMERNIFLEASYDEKTGENVFDFGDLFGGQN